MAPDFTLKNLLDDQTWTLSDLFGKPIMLTFWASWCPDCQRDLPIKAAFYKNMDKDVLHFLSINVTGREADPRNGLEFAITHRLPFPVLADVGRHTYEAYGCSGVPTTVLINKQGQVIHTFGDKVPFVDIMQSLSSLLND